jgi:hypothetical protein
VTTSPISGGRKLSSMYSSSLPVHSENTGKAVAAASATAISGTSDSSVV